jgi:hypothetical protein
VTRPCLSGKQVNRCGHGRECKHSRAVDSNTVGRENAGEHNGGRNQGPHGGKTDGEVRTEGVALATHKQASDNYCDSASQL